MIKIEKDVSAVPPSLIPAFPDLFPAGQNIPSITKNTHDKRMEIIDGKVYIDSDKYNALYKREEIKIALNNIYKSKCAYCESKVEQLHVEHYRPKKIYYWLAFSWDNLIIACPTCNQNKGVNFQLEGDQVEFENTEANVRNIHSSSLSYDFVENPRMVNPETTDPLGQIRFKKNGIIDSENTRFAYTIETCKIDRKWLNDERKHLLEIFERHIRSALLENDDPVQQQKEIEAIVRRFVMDSYDNALHFLGFRRFSVSSGWLNEIIKEMN